MNGFGDVRNDVEEMTMTSQLKALALNIWEKMGGVEVENGEF